MKHLILLTLSCLFYLSTIAQPALVMQNNVTYLNMMNGLPSNFVDDLYTDSYVNPAKRNVLLLQNEM